MKIVGKDKLTIGDDLNFILETRDTENFCVNPYQILNATIYFVSREFTDPDSKEYKLEYVDESLVEEYKDIKKEIYLKTKKSVKVATTTEISLAGEQQIDGVEATVDERVLVKNQSNLHENGIYTVSSGAWVRSNDANKSEKLKKGMYVFVENGISNSETEWILDCPTNIKLGSTSLLFLKYSSKEENLENSKLIKRLEFLKNKIEGSKVSSNFFYKDAIAVKKFGGYEDPETKEFFPAWLNPDYVSSDLKEKIIQENILNPYYENDEVKEGKFLLNWNPVGNREGDYFICWTWMPNLTGETKSEHLFFSLNGNSPTTASIPTHFTKPEKYRILNEKYLPDMFKSILSENDLTPQTLSGLNEAVSDGFSFLENFANQIIDLLNANSAHEQLLPSLSNMFNLKLKSDDPTLWRRQIKKAIPNYKKKGTIEGLKQALSDSGMLFLKLTKLWQVVSKYTHQEHFDYIESSEFELSKQIILPIDSNFRLWIRHKEENWEELTSNSNENWHEELVSFSENKMTWIGPNLVNGDSLRVVYKIKDIPPGEQSLEDYVRYLPLMDKRDERDQKYPPKNWNVHLIEEDDDMFDVIVPVRHPIADPTIWGKIRTEFAYSENAYNMDEYNGSKRDSYDPCHIGKEFIDECGDCQSSKFNLDIEIEKISNETLEEALKVVEEFMPFHAVVDYFNFSGSITEFVSVNDSKIEALINLSGEETVIAGGAQHIFNRDVDQVDIEKVKRNVLSNFEAIENSLGSTNWSGTIKNSKVILNFSGISNPVDLENYEFKNTQQNFNSININTSLTNQASAFDNSNLLELLTTTNKYYSISSFDKNKANLEGNIDTSAIGPLVEYRVSNLITDLNINITQSDQILFSDENSEFWMLGIVTEADSEDLSSVWTFSYQNKKYYISDILPNGDLLLREKDTTTTISGWEIYNGNDIVKQGENGNLSIIKRGLVESNSDVSMIKLKDYIYLDWQGSLRKYLIKSFKKNSTTEFYIEDYSEGTVVGVSCKIYRRILEKKIGQLSYEGIVLESSDNFETIFPINDINSLNIKENYLIFNDSKYYFITEANSQSLVLNGLTENWGLTGENIDFMVYKFSNKELDLSEREAINLPGHQFDSINRSGKEIIKIKQDNNLATSASLVNLANSNERIDIINQEESIEYNIEYKDGEQNE